MTNAYAGAHIRDNDVRARVRMGKLYRSGRQCTADEGNHYPSPGGPHCGRHGRLDGDKHVPWVTVTSPSPPTGSGDGTVTLTVGANSGVARAGTITIATQTFTVCQATGCSFWIQPVSLSISNVG